MMKNVRYNLTSSQVYLMTQKLTGIYSIYPSSSKLQKKGELFSSPFFCNSSKNNLNLLVFLSPTY